MESLSMIKSSFKDSVDDTLVVKKSRELKEKIKEWVNNDVLTYMW